MTTRTGRCLCGAVRFTVELADAPHVDACHCGMCRRWTGGPALAVMAKSSALAFDGDPEALGAFVSSDWAERLFCKKCGSPLAWRLRGGDLATISAGALDDQTGLEFSTEIYVDEQPGYYAFAGARKRMTGAEVAAMFAGPPPRGAEPT